MAGKQYGQAMAVSSKPMLVSPLSPTLQPVRYILFMYETYSYYHLTCVSSFI